MGRALHRQHIRWFLERMNGHDKVKSCTPIDSDDEFLFRVERVGGLRDIVVHLTDAYRYGEVDFLARPKEIGRGAYVVMGMPHADYDENLVGKMRDQGVG